ncbi:MAG: type II toxin-antitoxin system PemK/MazF family toxin [Acidobacteriota bacterium]|nr:type II toxin-antitoxin system PemK/MazF family toxin [Acidobacteriota bacterium]
MQCAGRAAVAVVDQIRAIAKERLGERLGTLSAEHLIAIEEALKQVLDLN